MSVTLGKLAELVDGRVIGNPTTCIDDAATLRNVAAGQITFATNATLFADCLLTPATGVVVSGVDEPGGKPCIVVLDAESAFSKIVAYFHPPVVRPRIGVSPQAHVASSAILAPDVNIYPGVFVGEGTVIGAGSTLLPGVCVMENCRIGNHVTIFPNAVLYENTIVGDRSLIHAGVVLGAYGFGYRTRDDRHFVSAQLGSVVIGSDVDLGANTTVDRGTFDATVIGDGTKIDNLVMIAHNCRIGKHNLLCSQVGIAGSCTTGDYVVMGGQVGVGDHIHIGDRANLCAQSGVMREIRSGETVFGSPALPVREQMQQVACLNRLPEMRSQLKKIARQVEQMQQIQPGCNADLKAA